MQKLIHLIFLFIICIFLSSCGDKTSPTVVESDNHKGNLSDPQLTPSLFTLESDRLLQKGPIPNQESIRYLQIVEKKSNKQERFNHREIKDGSKTLVIEGQYVTLKAGHHSQLFELINNRDDIKELIINARVVEIFEAVKIPATALTIRAQQLIFHGIGSFNTTPQSYPTPANELQDGGNGIDATDVHLFIDSIEEDSTSTSGRFISNGGNGQDAGPGRNGSAGASLGPISGTSNVVYQSIEVRECFETTSPGENRVIVKRSICDFHYTTQGVNSCPTSGTNAQMAGKAGLGGRPGNIYSNLNKDILSRFVMGTRGSMGQKAADNIGGAPGTPINAVHQTIRYNRNVDNTPCPTTSKGNDAAAPTLSQTEAKSVIYFGQKMDGESFIGRHLGLEIQYANDLYANGHFEMALNEFHTIQKTLDKAHQHVEKFAIHEEIAFQRYLSIVQQRILQIENGRDIFGHHAHWIPGVSFEVSQKFLADEISIYFQTLYLTQWIKRISKNHEAKKEALSLAIAKVYEALSQGYEKESVILKLIPTLKKDLDELSIHEKFFNDIYTKIESEIRSEAERHIHSEERKNKLRQALLGIAGLARAMPAGQPAFGAVGSTIQNVLTLTNDEESFFTRLKTIPKLSTAYTQLENLKESRNDWYSKHPKLSLDQLTSMKPGELTRQLKQTYDFYSPVLDELQKQVAQFRDIQMPVGTLEKEIRRLEEMHPSFRQITNTLRGLQAKKANVISKLSIIQTEMQNLDLDRMEQWAQLSTFQMEFHKEATYFSPETLELVSALEQRSYLRLQKYRYTTSKAFSYRLLESINLQTNPVILINQIAKLIENEERPDDDFDKIKELKAGYFGELAEFYERIFDNIVSGNNHESSTQKHIRFNAAEIETLNKGDVIYLNTFTRNIFPEFHDNVRILDIEISSMATSLNNLPAEAEHGNLDITIQHPGKFYVRRNGIPYYFEMDDPQNGGPFTWGARFDLLSQKLSQYKKSSVFPALFRNLLHQKSVNNTEEKEDIYIRPGGLTEFKISLRKDIPKNVAADITSLELIIHYSFIPKMEHY
ncbi:MAG: hypothetical protein HYV97_15850 [Bdellovibrio sp.]|nr:hypothetical protein [Bdellovibrio sp.]